MRRYKQFRLPTFSVCCLLGVAFVGSATAEIRNSGNSNLRIRVGPGSGVATVIYNAGIPGDLSGLPGVISAPTTVSTNPIPGGRGVYTVRFVTDANARLPIVGAPFEGTYFYDSSAGMNCSTATTCGSASINFNKISWTARDGDTHNTVFQYDGMVGQQFQQQTDFNPFSNGTNSRHRNYYRFQYNNDELLPAGTYEGTVVVSGVGVGP